jgi:hypothetical protein
MQVIQLLHHISDINLIGAPSSPTDDRSSENETIHPGPGTTKAPHGNDPARRLLISRGQSGHEAFGQPATFIGGALATLPAEIHRVHTLTRRRSPLSSTIFTV